ncbi:MAG: ATP-dependent RecD-like DNA helicase [Candidatus Latescibacteria bacterium]|nr:ATP-dependent RecD-like DNA helicase [Candidatus Latescibacterota bacterium]
MDTLEGIIERVTFHNPENGYTVAKLFPTGRRSDLIPVIGTMASVTPGESVVLEGFWVSHPEYGRQFKIVSYRTVLPATVEGIRRYLGSGLIKGIGPVTARRIVATFGEQTIEVIDRDPDRLIEAEGIGPKRVAMIKRAWAEQKEIKDVMLFLSSHDVSTTYATKIWKEYGQRSIELVRENPYRLATDIWGIGFLTADRIARKLGIDPHSEKRIRAGILHVLREACDDEGHIYLPRDVLFDLCTKQLDIDHQKIEVCLAMLEQENALIIEEDRIYPRPLYYAEQGVAAKLHQLSQILHLEPGADIGREINAIERATRLTFATNQREAIVKALSSHLLVLTGGPGTGKTTTIRGMIALFERRRKRILLAAPTGRAAKRLAETTGREAKTIHRLLKFTPQTMTFERNQESPLEADVVIIDETSMIDILLINNLLKAVPLMATLVLVGDVDQLPSVGSGNVLRDIIASGVVPVVRLNEIFRQAEASRIVVNAHFINKGEFPDLKNAPTSDFFFIERDDPDAVVTTILDLCVSRLPKRYGYDPIGDIQVLAPMYRGETGVANLNTMLQERLNPEGVELRRGGMIFRVGDKVMQTRNNYTEEVFNGDIGRIVGIDLEDQDVRVDFDGVGVVSYDLPELDELALAYSVSVHKSQGSEYRAVVIPVTTQHYMMLQRNLLYTAVTRAKELVVLVGTKKALAIAVKNDRVAQRFTTLRERLTKKTHR